MASSGFCRGRCRYDAEERRFGTNKSTDLHTVSREPVVGLKVGEKTLLDISGIQIDALRFDKK